MGCANSRDEPSTGGGSTDITGPCAVDAAPSPSATPPPPPPSVDVIAVFCALAAVCVNRREVPSTSTGIIDADTVLAGPSATPLTPPTPTPPTDTTAVFCTLAAVCANKRDVPSGIGAWVARSMLRCFSISRDKARVLSWSRSRRPEKIDRKDERRWGRERDERKGEEGEKGKMRRRRHILVHTLE